MSGTTLPSSQTVNGAEPGLEASPARMRTDLSAIAVPESQPTVTLDQARGAYESSRR